MSNASWRIDEPVPGEDVAAGPEPALVSMHFLLTALRRRWRVWVTAGCLGLLLGLAWTVALPPSSTGTVTVLLAHDPDADTDQAMATDISLFRTRSVAERVIDRLDLGTTPDKLQTSVTLEQVSSSVLVIDVAAPDDRAAVVRARTLAQAFLGFRDAQFRTQTQAMVDAYEQRVASLQRQVDSLTRQYDALSKGGPAARDQASGVLSQRSQLTTEISSLQQTIQDTVLKNNSVLAASHVLDPASVVPYSAKKHLVLTLGSGLVGGLALGMGLVLFQAISSDRLRRREEVAMALGVPVRFSVGELRRRRLGVALRKGPSPARNLQVLVYGLDSAVAGRRAHPRRLALAAADNPGDAARVVAGLAAQLAARGLAVFLVDLTEAGHLQQALASALGDQGAPDEVPAPVVFEPQGVPSLARGPLGAGARGESDLPPNDARRTAWESADVVLTLAEVDPAVGVEHLTSWADQVVLLVTAGRCSAELLRTTAELFRAARLPLLFAMMVRADRTDQSLGLPDTPDDTWPETRRSS